MVLKLVYVFCHSSTKEGTVVVIVNSCPGSVWPTLSVSVVLLQVTVSDWPDTVLPYIPLDKALHAGCSGMSLSLISRYHHSVSARYTLIFHIQFVLASYKWTKSLLYLCWPSSEDHSLTLDKIWSRSVHVSTCHWWSVKIFHQMDYFCWFGWVIRLAGLRQSA